MKKVFALAISAILLVGCTNPNDIVLNSKEDIEKHSEDFEKLSDEDRQLLAAYIIRVELGNLGGQDNKATYGVTVKEAIENQRVFAAEKEREKKEAEEKLEKLNKSYEIGFGGFEKVDIPGVGDGIKLKMIFKNNSAKPVSAISGDVNLSVEGLNQSRDLLLGDEVFNPAVEAGHSSEINFVIDTNSLEATSIMQGTAVVKLKFSKLTVLHPDGSIETVE